MRLWEDVKIPRESDWEDISGDPNMPSKRIPLLWRLGECRWRIFYVPNLAKRASKIQPFWLYRIADGNRVMRYPCPIQTNYVAVSVGRRESRFCAWDATSGNQRQIQDTCCELEMSLREQLFGTKVQNMDDGQMVWFKVTVT